MQKYSGNLKNFISQFSNPRVSLSKIKDVSFINDVMNETSWLLTDKFSQRLWHIINDEHEIPKCPLCGNDLSFKTNTYTKYCSDSCAIKMRWKNTTPEKREKIKENQLRAYNDKYGGHPFKHKNVKEKIKCTFKERYGVENNSQIKECMDRKRSTTKAHFGHENFGHTGAAAKTFTEKYGGPNPFYSDEIKEKIKSTNRERYGTDYPIQNSDFFAKNAHKFNHKIFISESGKRYTLQGYEDIALLELLKIYPEDDILHGKELYDYIAPIWYIKNDKRARYFPDFYIKSINTVIEVKSTWTYNYQKILNEQKSIASIKNGLNFEFWIMSETKILQIMRVTEDMSSQIITGM